MARGKRGFDRGTTLSYPLRLNFKPEGTTRMFSDTAFQQLPRLHVDMFEDFADRTQIYTIDVPIMTAAGANRIGASASVKIVEAAPA